MNLTRLLQMSPAEIGTRAQQAFSKRWSHPPSLPANPVHPPSPPSQTRPLVAREAEKSAAAPLRPAGLQRSRFRYPHRLALRPRTRQARPPQTLVSNPIPRLRSNRRPQNHLGAEPPPAPRHAGPSRFPRRNPGPMDSLAKRKPLPHRHQLGQHAGGRLPGAVLALGAHFIGDFHRTYSPRSTSTAGTSSAFCPLTSLRTRTC
jgi:hypothetical protein